MKTIPLTGILLALMAGFYSPAGAEDYSVPNQGSPYRNLGELKEGEILHLPTGLTVSVEQMIDTVSASRVIYVGETHDNLEAHRVQLEVIRRLQEQFPGQISVGVEMFRRSAQDDLDRWQNGNLTDKQFRKLFRKNWGPGYAMYQPIFEYLKENSIPLIGLKSSRALEQKFRDGGPEQDGMPEIDLTDEYHRAYSMSLFGGNDTHTGVVSKPYQMLLLWEESMAETVANFLKDDANKNRKLVVLAGGFHVQYGYGIPKRAFRRVPHAYSIILPTVTEIPKELKNREMKMKTMESVLHRPATQPHQAGSFSKRDGERTQGPGSGERFQRREDEPAKRRCATGTGWKRNSQRGKLGRSTAKASIRRHGPSQNCARRYRTRGIGSFTGSTKG
jgi:uncharacterized iron-regulated protein